ncbi:MAG: ferritin-like domain-containing protein [Gemmatimonadetes bacterium]|nr:ferritin-like domain-containing protein [Gemmatimonadota bacterium]
MSEQRRDETVESGLLAGLGATTGRRSFLKWSGAAAVTAAVAGCGDFGDKESTSVVGPVVTPDLTINLDFSNDFGILNYAFALEQLEAAFYQAVVTSSTFATTFTAQERLILTDIRDHEVAHREFFKAAIPAANRIPDLTPVLTSVNLSNKQQVLNAARDFEDLGVVAYNGAGPLFSNTDTGRTLLTVAGKIVSVEARHAAAIRDLISPRTRGAAGFAPKDFDDFGTPGNVLGIAQQFIAQPLRAINVPGITNS